jgi:flagellar basal body P-ring protein FlgI
MKRRHFFWLLSGTILLCLGGCSWWDGTMRSQSPDESAEEDHPARMVGDIAVPTLTSLTSQRVEAIGMVGGLHGTGSDPGPSQYRAALLEEMQIRGVRNPNAVLASKNFALVIIQGWLRPGAQKGDHFDIELRVPSQSDTTSLRGGALWETRLMEMAVLDDHQVHHGNLLALAQGPVLIDPSHGTAPVEPSAEGKAGGAPDRGARSLALCRGRVLGGGVVLKSRPLGLVLTSNYQSVKYAADVASAINHRFYIPENGIQTGMAKAKTDEYIELNVHPCYKDNIARYLRVVKAVPLKDLALGGSNGRLGDLAGQRMQRVEALRAELLDPETSADAAIALEAVGSDGIDALLSGLGAKQAEVRFYAAETLAYLSGTLNHTHCREAAATLGQIARDEPAFRVFALSALSAMQDFAAYEQLRDLLPLPSAETRYGAFRALWAMNRKDPLVKGETIGEAFQYHLLDVGGPPMIHVTYNRLPEIVVFGRDQRLLSPLAINAGNDIMITSFGGDQVAVSKYTVADGDQKRIVSGRVDDVIRAVVELGGGYPDVIQALQEAKRAGALPARFEVDALPEAGRTYERPADDAVAEAGQNADANPAARRATTPRSPSPDLFYKDKDQDPSDGGSPPAKAGEKTATDESDEDTAPKKGFFDRMFGG